MIVHITRRVHKYILKVRVLCCMIYEVNFRAARQFKCVFYFLLDIKVRDLS